jgi:DNA-binding NarL/FixJ family response regulator
MRAGAAGEKRAEHAQLPLPRAGGCPTLGQSPARRAQAKEEKSAMFEEPHDASESRIRVGLVEASALARDALSIALAGQGGLGLAFAVPAPDEVPAEAGADVLLFSARFPGELLGDGLALDYWRTRCPGSRLVLVTPCRALKTVRAVVGAGVDGYAIHDAITVQALGELIRRAHRDPPALCDETRRVLAQPASESDLTYRELQTVQMLRALGLSNRKRAAGQLDMSEKTLNVHLRNVCAKLQVSGAAEAVQRCVEMGLIE